MAQPSSPISWPALLLFVSGMDDDVLLRDKDGYFQYPSEWAYDRRSYRPSEPNERYILQDSAAWQVNPQSGALLGKVWEAVAAPVPTVIDSGCSNGLVWQQTEDERLTLTFGDARLLYRLVMREYGLCPVTVFKSAGWNFETESRAFNLADRIAEAIHNRRAGRSHPPLSA